jgi:hypothetical protein
VSDQNGAMNSYELREALREANLEELGFSKTTEVSIGTDENGKKRKTIVLRYLVKDEFSQAKTWQEKLEEKLPPNFFSPSVIGIFSRDVQDGVSDRPTKFCLIGLEMVSSIPLSKQIRARPKRAIARIRIG